jgi:hypothetical protein
MTGIEFGLGQFGDRRLEKGGLFCTRPLLSGRVRVCAGLLARERERCSLHDFCATHR